MASSLREQFEEHLTCSICLEQLTDPRVLPCLHSYCCQCIVRLAKDKDTIACPDCRKTVKVGNPPDLSFLPSNFFANNLLASLSLTSDKENKKQVLCDNCDAEDPAETRCQQCGLFLCHFCTESHKRSRATKSHDVVLINELKSNGPASVAEIIRCTKHKEEIIKLYCETCQVTICRDCTIVDHRQHDYSFVDDVEAEKKLNLENNLGEVKARKARIVEGISKLKEFEKYLINRNESTISEIDEHFNMLIEAVNSRRKKLAEEATLLTNSKVKQISAQCEGLKMGLVACESSIEFTEQALKNGNNVQILSMEKHILQSLEDLKSVQDQTKPCVSGVVTFIVPASVQKIDNDLLELHLINDAKVCPEFCSASFQDSGILIKPGVKAVIKVVCKDQTRNRVRYGGQSIEPKFTGVVVSDVSVVDNKDGSHNVNFVPCQTGMLECELVINGNPAVNCTLKDSVKWRLSSTYGTGAISDDGLTMTSEETVGKRCYRAGDCRLNSEINTWVVEINKHDCNNHDNYSLQHRPVFGLVQHHPGRRRRQRRCISRSGSLCGGPVHSVRRSYFGTTGTCSIEVGVIESSVCQPGAEIDELMELLPPKIWVHKVSLDEASKIYLELDMKKNMLVVTLYLEEGEYTTRECDVPPGLTFSPFFALTPGMIDQKYSLSIHTD